MKSLLLSPEDTVAGRTERALVELWSDKRFVKLVRKVCKKKPRIQKKAAQVRGVLFPGSDIEEGEI